LVERKEGKKRNPEERKTEKKGERKERKRKKYIKDRKKN
jgi:hypothetical protein